MTTYWMVGIEEVIDDCECSSACMTRVGADQDPEEVALALAYEFRHGSDLDEIDEIEESLGWDAEAEMFVFSVLVGGREHERSVSALEQIDEEMFDLLRSERMPGPVRLHDSTPDEQLVKRVASVKNRLL